MSALCKHSGKTSTWQCTDKELRRTITGKGRECKMNWLWQVYLSHSLLSIYSPIQSKWILSKENSLQSTFCLQITFILNVVHGDPPSLFYLNIYFLNTPSPPLHFKTNTHTLPLHFLKLENIYRNIQEELFIQSEFDIDFFINWKGAP